ncbi:hypothetical protein [Labilibaculum filiforme]|uniref:hypothetical protein n=1 Tax=Labilibaculum filiforme TaxID=1940526 RepID=UPI0015D5C626|nr:hypothetical protein [Labilibaculum filiforme]
MNLQMCMCEDLEEDGKAAYGIVSLCVRKACNFIGFKMETIVFFFFNKPEINSVI